MARSTLKYSPEYIETCFTTWVGLGRVPLKSLPKRLPKDEHGRIPSYTIIIRWHDEEGWANRADEIQTKAIERTNEFIIQSKSQLLIKQFNESLRVSDAAYRHIISGTFDSSSAAVQAFFRGLEEQRKVVGISDMIEKLGKMSDEEVRQEIMARVKRASDAGQIIEGDINSGADQDNPSDE